MVSKISFIIFLLFIISTSFAQSSPQHTFEKYLRALKEADVKTYLSLLTADSKKVVRPLKELMLREYEDLKDLNFYIEVDSSCTATVYFNPPSKKVPPYLLKKENGEWKVDLKTMSQIYIFDENNNWHYKE
ncbi:MAG: hypothetical protein B6D55_06440 [Candidatus Omnitrophica bacterium 4484_70.2]|nr:MAG: hypothetical protein B6D55_06440 [Candidatus Omnitrophica bacterium 4484_70.2]